LLKCPLCPDGGSDGESKFEVAGLKRAFNLAAGGLVVGGHALEQGGRTLRGKHQPTVTAATHVHPRNIKAVDQPPRFGAVNAHHHEVGVLELVGGAKILNDAANPEGARFVIESVCKAGHFCLTDVVAAVLLVAEVAFLDDVSVHQGDVSGEVHPSQACDEQFNELGSNAAGTDDKQVFWDRFRLHGILVPQGYLKNAP
jgi:hypothetical protein